MNNPRKIIGVTSLSNKSNKPITNVLIFIISYFNQEI